METQELALPQTTSLSPKQQQGWIMIGTAKADLQKQHELKGLELQQLLINPGTTITEIENTLATYRKKHADMVKAGQDFRTVIDNKVLQPSLSVEARWSYKWNKDTDRFNEDYLQLEKIYNKMRIAADTRHRTAQAHEQEKQLYTAHIKNQYEIQIKDYKTRCITEVNTMKVSYLKGNVQDPDVAAIKAVIEDFKLTPGVKYNRTHVTDDEAKAILASIPKPNLQLLQAEMLDYCDDQFITYHNDLRSNSAEQVEQLAQQEIQNIEQEAATNVGVNNLGAQAMDVVSVVMEGKPLRKIMEVVNENTQAWAMHVDFAFWKNPLIISNLSGRVAWENLNTKQKAAAISRWASETGEMDKNLQYKEVVK